MDEVINCLTTSFRNLQVNRNFLLYLSKRWNLEMHSNCVADANIDPNVGLQISVVSLLKFEPKGDVCFRSS